LGASHCTCTSTLSSDTATIGVLGRPGRSGLAVEIAVIQCYMLLLCLARQINVLLVGNKLTGIVYVFFGLYGTRKADKHRKAGKQAGRQTDTQTLNNLLR
jgi:hypothetical protein